MNRNLCLITLAVLLGVFLTDSAFSQPPKVLQIDVKVVSGKPTGTDKGKINGKSAMLWDVKPAIEPDIALCISENNAAYKCVSNDCPNSYSCSFIGVPLTAKNFRLKILDKDIFEHDDIGEGTCGLNQTCSIGQAQVTVTEVPCADEEIMVNYDKNSIGYYDVTSGFKPFLMTYHLYVLENKICDTTTPNCTSDLVFSTMISQLQFIAPANDSKLKVKNCMVADADVPGPFGDDPIRIAVNPNRYSITNYTKKDHPLHPGKVTRTIIKKGNAIYVLTEGEGLGKLPLANMYFATNTWNPVDEKLTKAVKQKLEKK